MLLHKLEPREYKFILCYKSYGLKCIVRNYVFHAVVIQPVDLSAREDYISAKLPFLSR